MLLIQAKGKQFGSDQYTEHGAPLQNLCRRENMKLGEYEILPEKEHYIIVNAHGEFIQSADSPKEALEDLLVYIGGKTND